MKIFDLTDDMSGPARWHLGELTTPSGNEVWMGGSTYHGERPLRTEVHYPGPALDFTMTTFGAPIVTNEIAHALELTAGADIQLIDTVVVSGKRRLARQAVNCVRVIDCLDEARSTFQLATPRRPPQKRYQAVYRIVIDRNRVPQDAHMFLLEGVWISS